MRSNLRGAVGGWSRWTTGWVWLLTAACNVTVPDGVFTCSTQADCPSHFVCDQDTGHCMRNGQNIGPQGTGDAAMPDAGETPTPEPGGNGGNGGMGGMGGVGRMIVSGTGGTSAGTSGKGPVAGAAGDMPQAGHGGADEAGAAGIAEVAGSGGITPAACTQECCDDSACPATAKCQQNKCVCPTGRHRCADACVDDKAVATCGQSCDACTTPAGGSASCDGTQCAASCPTDTRLCAGKCIGASTPCTGMCPDTTHNCSDNCVANSSVTACGTLCTPCAVPANGAATCDGKACGFSCDSTHKKCGAACIPTNACCTNTDCDATDFELCDTTTHACVCDSTHKLCGGKCIAMDACCSATDCTGGKACNASHQCACADATPQDCNGTCLASTACCTTCSVSHQVCDATSHSCSCDPASYKACGSACILKTACCASTDTGKGCTRSSGGSGVCSSSGSCVECAVNADCTSAAKPYCDATQQVCVGCRSDADCSNLKFGQCSSGGTCVIGPGCGNGRLDPGEPCDINAAGPNSTVKWTATTCDSACSPLIYILATQGDGCQAPKTRELAACTVSCTKDADCPALAGYPAGVCITDPGSGASSCSIPCTVDTDCYKGSNLFCIAANGLTPPRHLCANGF
jgi:hypothetical protein